MTANCGAYMAARVLSELFFCGRRLAGGWRKCEAITGWASPDDEIGGDARSTWQPPGHGGQHRYVASANIRSGERDR